jgi:hypothetical protein
MTPYIRKSSFTYTIKFILNATTLDSVCVWLKDPPDFLKATLANDVSHFQYLSYPSFLSKKKKSY